LSRWTWTSAIDILPAQEGILVLRHAPHTRSGSVDQGSVIVTLPIIIVFFAGERLPTEGLTAGAEKG
jgi:ABC-type glycerol-3-phosphate transport system permease component